MIPLVVVPREFRAQRDPFDRDEKETGNPIQLVSTRLIVIGIGMTFRPLQEIEAKLGEQLKVFAARKIPRQDEIRLILQKSFTQIAFHIPGRQAKLETDRRVEIRAGDFHETILRAEFQISGAGLRALTRLTSMHQRIPAEINLPGIRDAVFNFGMENERIQIAAVEKPGFQRQLYLVVLLWINQARLEKFLDRLNVRTLVALFRSTYGRAKQERENNPRYAPPISFHVRQSISDVMSIQGTV